MNVLSSTALIGNTPLVDLSKLVGKPGVRLFGKCEGHNPGGSVKDRPALYMIEGAEARGELRPGVRLIEPTSGNTGIGLAMIAAMKGYSIELVMPEDATRERVLSMEAYGAKVILTPAAQGMEGTIDYARAKVAEGGYLMLDQFSNPDNWRSHLETTGPEIWRDTDGGITHFVSSMGTTGTIMGCSRFFKSKSEAIQIVGVRPDGDSRIPGIRRWPEAYLPRIFEAPRVDRFVDVSQAQATTMTRRLAKELGLSVGMSAGGATHAAVEVARGLDQGLVVCILCDRGDRYLSSGLFEGSQS
ncbi:MAG: cysteine synthase CysM [Deltaproteobacteria bacterium]|nr:cysteine synthase CysM [Deltaproteobacteria bacterium]